MLESLEARQLLSITIHGNEIVVEGSEYGDVIIVDQLSDNSFEIYDNGMVTTITTDKTIKKITLNGNGGNDMLMLQKSVTVDGCLNGEDGDDTLIGGSGDDLISGGSGVDTVDYSAEDWKTLVSLDNVQNDGVVGMEHDNVYDDVENVITGDGDDIVIGSSADNTIITNGGNDFVWGNDGDDLIDGGDGDDDLDGGLGDDVIIGGMGADFIKGGKGNDTLYAAWDGAVDTVIGNDDVDTAYLDQMDFFGGDVEFPFVFSL